MTSIKHKIEVLSGPERRRRWSTAEKLAIIHETYEADATVSIVARRHGIQPNQLFAWRKLASQGALTATAAEEEVVPASEYRALQAQVKELQRLLGKKTMESEILKEALEIAGGPKKTDVALDLSSEGNFGMKAVCETLGVARSNIAARAANSPSRARGRPPLPDRELVEDIKAIIADMPTYGYRRVHAILRRNARKDGRSWPNAKRVYRVMKLHNLLLVRHTGAADDRLHDGQVAVERSNIRWCSDGFEIGCDNKEKVRVAFALDCCDREAIAHVATTEGIKSQDVQDLVITAVENRFGRINMLSEPIEWLTDNGSCFIARDTASLLRDIGMEPCTTPVRSPQSNGMAEAFVKTFKRDYVAVNPTPDAETVMAQLPFWFEHYNNLHPHSALGYQSPREFISSKSQA
ncbi:MULTISPECIES: IS3 family transposase [Sinorhizobium]|nr:MULTISPECIES: IS3 family transposase [Sinorhizobium]ASP56337.1 IS3 family transposase [Sinorhizobium meliloti]MBO1944213.1 IS3 family transposase [Sinorhizobium medicae]MBO1960437.1 IS3 family transposase [Sinorhizobium medicae]MBO1965283.1 IS3 family transposase [Sinorhizobium medicae]MBO1965387.1 IS3 family transposase [Sinorhizobium medicae]